MRFVFSSCFYLTVYCLLLVSPVGAQQTKEVTLRFRAEYAGRPLAFENGQCPIPGAPDTITLTAFRFYISNITLLQHGRTVWTEPNSFHLLDMGESAAPQLSLQVPEGTAYDTLCFFIGIDSLTNTRGAGSGALDAMHGMYWAWHSGYINIKLEGSSPKCATRRNEFRFHCGGFRAGENAAQQKSFAVRAFVPVTVGIDLARFFGSTDLRTQNLEMTPGSVNVQLSRRAASMFYLHPQRP